MWDQVVLDKRLCETRIKHHQVQTAGYALGHDGVPCEPSILGGEAPCAMLLLLHDPVTPCGFVDSEFRGSKPLCFLSLSELRLTRCTLPDWVRLEEGLSRRPFEGLPFLALTTGIPPAP